MIMFFTVMIYKSSLKKVLILFFLVGLMGCDLGDDQPNFSLEIMPIETVDVPDEFIRGQTHEISVTYTRPNGCHEFNDFIINAEGNTRTIAVVDTVYNETCTQATVTATVSFEFLVLSDETYIFQFYQGEGSDGNDQYLIVEIPVVDQ